MHRDYLVAYIHRRLNQAGMARPTSGTEWNGKVSCGPLSVWRARVAHHRSLSSPQLSHTRSLHSVHTSRAPHIDSASHSYQTTAHCRTYSTCPTRVRSTLTCQLPSPLRHTVPLTAHHCLSHTGLPGRSRAAEDSATLVGPSLVACHFSTALTSRRSSAVCCRSDWLQCARQSVRAVGRSQCDGMLRGSGHSGRWECDGGRGGH